MKRVVTKLFKMSFLICVTFFCRTSVAQTVGPVCGPVPPNNAEAAQVPDYPTEAYRLREEGVVEVAIFVSHEGSIVDVQLRKSSGYEHLDAGAMEFARKRFKCTPGTKDGEAIDSVKVFPLTYKIRAKNRK